MGTVLLEVPEALLGDESAAFFDEGFPTFPAGMCRHRHRLILQTVTSSTTCRHVVRRTRVDAIGFEQ